MVPGEKVALKMKTKLLIIFLLIFLSFIFSVFSWAFCKRHFTKADNAGQFFLAKGKIFKIELEANPTTGFEWHFDGPDLAYFEMVKSGYNPLRPQRMGSGGKSFWFLRPIKAGEKIIRLLYYRKWEGPKKAVDKFEIKLIIKD